ncbi:MAG: hypothetical protein ACK559_29295, partial [bacterium]
RIGRGGRMRVSAPGRRDAFVEAGHGPLVEHPIPVKHRGDTRDVLGELGPVRAIHDIAADARGDRGPEPRVEQRA